MKQKTTRELVLEMRSHALWLAERCNDLVDQLNSLGVDTATQHRYACPTCGIPAKSQRQLDEHVYDIHDGPRPEHFDRIEAKIAPDWTPDEEAA